MNFKKGDIVTHGDHCFPGEFVLTQVHEDYVVAQQPEGGKDHYFAKPGRLTLVPQVGRVELEKVEVEPKHPAVGTKVRVTYEGTVEDPDAYGFRVRVESGHKVYIGKASHTVEVLEEPKPKPLQVGTVALHKHDPWALPVIRTFEGQWHRHGGHIAKGVTDAKVRSDDYDVLYEPEA